MTPRVRIEADGVVRIVRLGPPRYLRRQGIEIKPGDEVEVTGAVRPGGQRVLVAATVKVGDQVFTLRDAEGRGAWESRGARRGPGRPGGAANLQGREQPPARD
jgi:hypothetical protein